MQLILSVFLLSASSIVIGTKANGVGDNWWNDATDQSGLGISLVKSAGPNLVDQNLIQEEMGITPSMESMQNRAGKIKNGLSAQTLMQQSIRMNPTPVSGWSRWWLPCAVLVAMFGLVGSASSMPLGAETLSQSHVDGEDDAIAWKPTLGFQRSHGSSESMSDSLSVTDLDHVELSKGSTNKATKQAAMAQYSKVGKLSKRVDALVEDTTDEIVQPHVRVVTNVALQQEVANADTSEAVPHASVLGLQRRSRVTKRSGALLEDDHETSAQPKSQNALNANVHELRPTSSSHDAPPRQQSSQTLLGLQRNMHVIKTGAVTENVESDEETQDRDQQFASSNFKAQAMETPKQRMGASVLALQRGYVVKKTAAPVED